MNRPLPLIYCAENFGGRIPGAAEYQLETWPSILPTDRAGVNKLQADVGQWAPLLKYHLSDPEVREAVVGRAIRAKAKGAIVCFDLESTPTKHWAPEYIRAYYDWMREMARLYRKTYPGATIVLYRTPTIWWHRVAQNNTSKTLHEALTVDGRDWNTAGHKEADVQFLRDTGVSNSLDLTDSSVSWHLDNQDRLSGYVRNDRKVIKYASRTRVDGRLDSEGALDEVCPSAVCYAQERYSHDLWLPDVQSELNKWRSRKFVWLWVKEKKLGGDYDYMEPERWQSLCEWALQCDADILLYHRYNEVGTQDPEAIALLGIFNKVFADALA